MLPALTHLQTLTLLGFLFQRVLWPQYHLFGIRNAFLSCLWRLLSHTPKPPSAWPRRTVKWSLLRRSGVRVRVIFFSFGCLTKSPFSIAGFPHTTSPLTLVSDSTRKRKRRRKKKILYFAPFRGRLTFLFSRWEPHAKSLPGPPLTRSAPDLLYLLSNFAPYDHRHFYHHNQVPPLFFILPQPQDFFTSTTFFFFVY